MAILPDNLVKEFVKITNDRSEPKKESFMYGTVHIADNHMDVLLDGAPRPTPCVSSVYVADGDRVLVMLKNRQAVISANITNPSINTEYLQAGEAFISGTIHAARYEDSTGDFTMEIGSEIPTGDDGTPIVNYSNPTFKIAGYVGEDSNKKYLEVSIDAYKTDSADLPQLNISAVFKNNPTDPDGTEHMVGIDIGPSGIAFYGHWPPGDSSSRVSTSLPWGYHV